VLTRQQLEQIGFATLGEDIQISPLARFYGAERIHLGSHVRIDDFCILSIGEGGIEIGSFVHIAAYCSLIGQAKISMQDFSGLSSRVSVYSSSDDYSGRTLTNPTVPEKYKAVTHAPVLIGRHVIVGAGSVILPGAQLGEGSAVGALSLVTKTCEPFWIYAGYPAKKIKKRDDRLLSLEEACRNENNATNRTK
jgi:galactoside O-acetyltransferase